MQYYVDLSLNTNKITYSKWQSFYNDTLLLLKKSPCMRLKKKKIMGSDKFVLTQECEVGIGNDDRRWEVCCEAETLRMGDIFCLHSSLDYYNNKKEQKQLIKIFNGYIFETGYHRFVLAVVLMAIDLFSKNVEVSGFLSQKQLEVSLLWAEKILGRRIDSKSLYKDNNLDIDTFNKPFSGVCDVTESMPMVMKKSEMLNKKELSILTCIAYVIRQKSVIRLINMLNSTFGNDKEMKKDFLKVYITRGINEIMTEAAWKKIETEKSIFNLYLLAGVASVENSYSGFRDMKLAIFENREIFKKLCELCSDVSEDEYIFNG